MGGFRRPASCEAQLQRSTGCTRHGDAVRWCGNELRKRKNKRESISLAEYAKGFWNQGAPFAMDRAAHGRAVSNGYLDIFEG